MDKSDLLTIREVVETLGVSIDTLRRWDKQGKLHAFRFTPTGHRYYPKKEIYDLLPKDDIFLLAKDWVSNQMPIDLPSDFYADTNDIFNARLEHMAKNLDPLIVAIAGEIGNNSFNHNIGNWPDVPGVFFGYDSDKKRVVLADRGQGILKTLKRVIPELNNDKNALIVAFTEFISARAPENRGNGLKFVRDVIINNNFSLLFQSGNAELRLKKGDKNLDISENNLYFRGCLVIINF